MIRKVLLVVMFGLFLVGNTVAQDWKRPTLFGFSPAFVGDSMPLFTPPSNPPYLAHEQLTLVLVQIDSAGLATRVESEDEQQARVATYVREYLSGLHYEPASFDGRPVGSVLPVQVTMRPSDRHPQFEFAFTEGGRVESRDLYFKAFAQNDIQFPTLTMFPKYFCNLPSDEFTRVYRMVLLKIALDAEGEVLEIQNVISTYPACAQTIASAALWANYTPARVKGQAVASECFVVVSFFPAINFSIGDWRPDESDTLSPAQRWRVELIADTVGLMRNPVPTTSGDYIVEVSAHRFPGSDTVTAVIRVDTSGHARVLRHQKVRPDIREAIRELKGKLEFHPALDYAGRPRSFTGMVHLVCEFSGRIRIVCLW